MSAKTIPLTIGTWNVHALIENTKSGRYERTAFVTRELRKYYIQIAFLSETRLTNEGYLTEVGAGCPFFWSGHSEGEHCEDGIGFAINTNAVNKLVCLPKGVKDSLMTMLLPLTGKHPATIICAYAPTMMNPDEIKEKCYKDLETFIINVPKDKKLIILGDFNA